MEIIIKQFASSQPLPSRKPGGVFTVFSWELRRMMGNRSSWIIALLVFGLFCAMGWLIRESTGVGLSGAPNQAATQIIWVHLTSNWGLIHFLPRPIFTLFGLLLPFVSAEGVSLDYKRRTHELLMTTAISSWSYLIGRYLAVSFLSLSLSVLMLLGIATSAFLNALPFPDVLVLLELWGIIILPTTLLLVSLSFAFGTLLPNHTNSVKALVVISWIALVFRLTMVSNLPSGDLNSSSLLAQWEPTSILLSRAVETSYTTQFFGNPGDIAGAMQKMRSVEQLQPDLTPWLIPHIILLLIGPLIVLAASFGFHRFSKHLN